MYSILNFNGHDVRMVLIDDEPYFVGKDVATILGYKRPDNAILTHVADEDKTYYQIQGYDSKRRHPMVVINKAGLCSIIYSTKFPQAREIQHWLASEIMTMYFEVKGE